MLSVAGDVRDPELVSFDVLISAIGGAAVMSTPLYVATFRSQSWSSPTTFIWSARSGGHSVSTPTTGPIPTTKTRFN